ncbi:hypothetical protein ACW9KT_00010 [Hymenobacter sp. HD11105]
MPCPGLEPAGGIPAILFDSMLSACLSRCLLLTLTVATLSCADHKGADPAPKPAPVLAPTPTSEARKTIVGHWLLKTQTIQEYNSAGGLMTDNTYQYAGTGEDYERFFTAEQGVRFLYKGGEQLAGTYRIEDMRLEVTVTTPNNPIPFRPYTILKLTATELELLIDPRTAERLSGVVTTQRYAKQ